MADPSITLPTLLARLARLALSLLLLAPAARAGDLHKCHRPWPAGGDVAEGKPLDLNALARLNRDVLSTQAAAAHRVRSTLSGTTTTIGDIEDAHVHADVTFGGLAATVHLARGCTTVLRAPPVSEGALVGANGARLATGDALPASCQVVFTPDETFSGEVIIAYAAATAAGSNEGEAVEGPGAPHAVVVHVVPCNKAPMASNDFAEAPAGRVVRLDVLSNDEDLDDEDTASWACIDYPAAKPESPSAAIAKGKVTFTDVAHTLGLRAAHSESGGGGGGGGGCVGDGDGDGVTDIFYPRAHGHDILYRGRGDGTFEDVSSDAGLTSHDGSHSSGCSFVDIDNDGDNDVYVGTYANESPMLYVNDGTGTFTEEAATRGLVHTQVVNNTVGGPIDVADFDHDGYLDIVVHDANGGSAYSRFFRNKGQAAPGHFEDAVETSPLDLTSRRALHIDIDNDGEDDVFAQDESTGKISLHLRPNLRRPDSGADASAGTTMMDDATNRMIDEAAARGLRSDANPSAVGSMAIDYDADGDLDIFVVNAGATPNLFRNDGGNADKWLRVKVKEGRDMGHRDSIGARVFIQPTDNKNSPILKKGIKSVASLSGQNEVVAHFGLGGAASAEEEEESSHGDHLPGDVVYKVRVIWPHIDGADSTASSPPLEAVLYNVPVRTTLIVRRPRSAPVVSNAGAVLPICTHKKVTAVASPKHGHAVVSANGRFVKYRALAHFSGQDSFIYMMEDGRGGSSRATVYVDVSGGSSNDIGDGGDTELSASSTSSSAASTTATEFASLNGRGNNIAFPDHEAAVFVQLQRLVPSAYGGDGLEDAAGSDRVSTRLISNVLFAQDKGTPTASIPSKQGLNDLHLHMGQFIAHDVSFVTPLADFYAAGNLAIPVPEGDTTFDPDYTGEAVIRFRRSGGKQGTGRKYGVPKEQVNKVTGWLDLSVVYGSAAERAVAIRTMKNGKIEMQMDGQNLAYNVKGIANLNLLGKKIERLVISGDNRVNVQPGLLTMHTLWAREHNRVVDALIEKDPTVSDRDLFLRARRFTVSTYQSIVLYEWLPTVIGDEFMRKFKLHSYEAGGKYSPKIDARVVNEFASVGFRFGHSQVTNTLHRLNPDLTASKHGHLNLRDNYFSPGRVLRQGGIDPILRGMIFTACQEVDTKAADGVRNFLFGTNTKGFDLVAINIQRGRDHGIPDYNTLREGVGLPRKTSFDDITSDTDIASKMKELYKGNVDNVDAFVGGLAEPHVAGGAVGELFATIIADQFARLRNGDRHWFENSAALKEDMHAIKRTTMAEVVARNSGVGPEDRVWAHAKLGEMVAFFIPSRQQASSSEL